MSDPHEQALDILQELNFTQEPVGKHIQIVSIYHEADKSSMQRLTSHLNVMRRQVAVNEDIHLDYKDYEIWTDYPSDDAQEGLSGANYLIILMSLELITALYNDAELYQALQRSMRNKGAIRDAGTTISIVLMTTKVQWDTNEFPVSTFLPTTAEQGPREHQRQKRGVRRDHRTATPVDHPEAMVNRRLGKGDEKR